MRKIINTYDGLKALRLSLNLQSEHDQAGFGTTRQRRQLLKAAAVPARLVQAVLKEMNESLKFGDFLVIKKPIIDTTAQLGVAFVSFLGSFAMLCNLSEKCEENNKKMGELIIALEFEKDLRNKDLESFNARLLTEQCIREKDKEIFEAEIAALSSKSPRSM